MPRALQVFASPRALKHLCDRGLQSADLRAVPAAAGGPGGWMLNLLERSLFGPGLLARTYIEQRLGASIVAWPMACAWRTRADAALSALAQG